MTKHQQFRQNYKPARSDEAFGCILTCIGTLVAFVGIAALLAFRG